MGGSTVVMCLTKPGEGPVIKVNSVMIWLGGWYLQH